MYLNDNNGVLFSTSSSWMSQTKPKILLEMGSVSVAFRQASFVGSREFKHTSQLWRQPKRYGDNLRDKITKPVKFYSLCANHKTIQQRCISRARLLRRVSQGITVLAATSSPGGTATGGTHSSRTKINALFADWHAETMPLERNRSGIYEQYSDIQHDPDGRLRWYLQ